MKWLTNRRRGDREEGSTLVLAGFMMAGLLAMGAVIADGGKLYAMKSHLQKTANAAALSGAQELVTTEAATRGVVQEVLQRHGELGSLSEAKAELGRKLMVRLHKEVPLSFFKLFGLRSVPVEAKAAASLETMGYAIGAAPLGIDESIPLEYGKQYKLKVDQTEVSSGNFGILALGGPGASTYEENLLHGYKNGLGVGDIVDTQTGNIAGKTREGVQQRIDDCPYPVGDISHRDCPRIILVPVYRPYDQSSNQLKHVKITGFAYFYITEPMSWKDTSITGMFIKRAGTGIVKPEAVTRGAYAIRLTE